MYVPKLCFYKSIFLISHLLFSFFSPFRPYAWCLLHRDGTHVLADIKPADTRVECACARWRRRGGGGVLWYVSRVRVNVQASEIRSLCCFSPPMNAWPWIRSHDNSTDLSLWFRRDSTVPSRLLYPLVMYKIIHRTDQIKSKLQHDTKSLRAVYNVVGVAYILHKSTQTCDVWWRCYSR